MSNEGHVLGGWSRFNFSITPEAKNVFDQALKVIAGVKYTPLAFATQVVAGLNYCFLTEGQVVIPENPQFAVLIHIYAPPGGQPHVTHISPIDPSA